MILNKLTLSNFSAYGTKQTLDLAPKAPGKPIVLVGGLNGAGKTSILTAIRIALYGKRAVTLEDSKSGYVKLLQGLIHNNNKSTSIELSFFSYSYGDKKKYNLKREWRESNGKIKENFSVWYNGKIDKILTGTWDEYVDALLPASISHLFFFDGEKVSDFATASGTSNLLKVGVKSLLGIDILERLRNDLADLIHSKVSKRQNNKDYKEFETINKEIDNLDKEQSAHQENKQKLKTKIECLTKQLVKKEQLLKEIGADLFLQRESIEKDLAESQQVLSTVQHGMADISASALPLLTVKNLINRVCKQDEIEHKAYQSQLVLEELQGRDQQLLDVLDGIMNSDLNKVKEFLTADIAQRAKLASKETFLNLSEDSRSALSSLNYVLQVEETNARDLMEQHQYWSDKISILERKIQMIPSEKDVAKEIAARDVLRGDIKKIKENIAHIDRQIESLTGNINFKNQERDRILKRNISIQLQNDDDQRIVAFAQKARERASIFEKRVIHQSIKKLESVILGCTKLLFRKDLFISDLKITPETYELLLFKPNGDTLSIDSLSSGERQILIIAVLWGLARASGKPLPLVVDTPLGRLDSEHRNNLVERYYSTASHQVVLLSTDTEIDSKSLPKVHNYLSHSYLLEHNSSTRQTSVRKGYFWS